MKNYLDVTRLAVSVLFRNEARCHHSNKHMTDGKAGSPSLQTHLVLNLQKIN